MLEELLLALLQRYRIDDHLALAAFQARLDHVPLGTVDHQRHFGNVRFARHHVDEAGHCRLAIDHAFVHVDVDDLCAILDLVARHDQRSFVIVGDNQLAELSAAGDVGALTDIHEIEVRCQRERLQPRQPHIFRLHRNLPRWHILDGLAESGDVLRLGAAAAADNVDQARNGEFADHLRHLFRRFIITAELVGKAGIGMRRHQRVAGIRHVGDIGPQFLGAQRAV